MGDEGTHGAMDTKKLKPGTGDRGFAHCRQFLALVNGFDNVTVGSFVTHGYLLPPLRGLVTTSWFCSKHPVHPAYPVFSL
jgi:hypothetical protein